MACPDTGVGLSLCLRIGRVPLDFCDMAECKLVAMCVRRRASGDNNLHRVDVYTLTMIAVPAVFALSLLYR